MTNIFSRLFRRKKKETTRRSSLRGVYPTSTTGVPTDRRTTSIVMDSYTTPVYVPLDEPTRHLDAETYDNESTSMVYDNVSYDTSSTTDFTGGGGDFGGGGASGTWDNSSSDSSSSYSSSSSDSSSSYSTYDSSSYSSYDSSSSSSSYDSSSSSYDSGGGW